MAKKTAVVDIEIGGLNSIDQLENYLEEINQELRTMDTNSDAFKELSNKAAQADGKLREVNTRLEGVTSTEKAEGILKLGEGFAGAFVAVQGLSLALGKNNEELEKVIQKVGGFIAALEGVRRVTEAFSAENIKRLRGVGRSFQTLTKTVNVSAKAMRTALISTGIGALLIAVTALIANWDKLTALINNKRREKQLKKELDILKERQTLQEGYVDAVSKEADLLEQLAQYNDDFVIAARARQSAVEGEIEALQTRYKILKNQLELEENKLISLIKHNGKKKKGYDEQLKVVTDINTELQSIDEQFALLIYKQQRLTAEAKAMADIVADGNMEKSLANQLTIMNAQEFTSRKQYQTQYAILGLQIKQIEAVEEYGGKLTKAEKEQIASLKAQRQALHEQEQIRIRNLKLELEELQAVNTYEEKLKEIGYDFQDINQTIAEIQTRQERSVLNAEAELAALEQDIELRDYILQQQKELIPFDQKGLEILEKTLGYKALDVQLGGELVGISIDISKLSEKTQLAFQGRAKAIKEIYDKQEELLQSEINSLDTVKQQISEQETLTWLISGAAGVEAKRFEAKAEALRLDAEETQNLEEKVKLLQEAEKAEVEAMTLRAEQQQYIGEALALQQEQEAITTEQLRLNNELDGVQKERVVKEKQISYEVDKQLRLSSRLKTFLDEYNKEIQAGRELIGQSFELWAAFADRRAEMMRREFEEQMDNLDRINDELSDQQDLREDYEELLKDANAERRDEILASLDDISDREGELQQQREAANKAALQAQYEMELAEWKAEKRRKAAAIIDATIQGAISVVESLPNIVLAAIVGALSAASIATIVAQPVPEKPEKPQFAEGGYTGDGNKNEPAGIVHRGEYVVPKSIVESNTGAQMIGVLEAMRMGFRGYAEGGIVTPATQTQSQNSQDFERLAENIANSLRRNPAVVSVVEITDLQNRVRVIENTAGF
jgi:hypothetical protein